jgi:site-specific recombinase XerC
MWYIDIESYDMALKELVNKKQITGDTAIKYLSCINQISKHTGGKIDINTLNSFLVDKLKDERQFSQYISAIRKYETYVLKQSESILFGQSYIDLVNHFKEIPHNRGAAGSGVMNETVARKINAIRNEKLKLAFRLQHKSGLRVKEISDLTKEDIFFDDNGQITIHVRSGKGRKTRDVHVREDPYLYERLKNFTEKSQGGRLFYSRSYLKQKAAEYGFESHDLRRHNAKKRFQDEIKDGKTPRQAKKTVQKEFGHEAVSTTEIYLKE